MLSLNTMKGEGEDCAADMVLHSGPQTGRASSACSFEQSSPAQFSRRGGCWGRNLDYEKLPM